MNAYPDKADLPRALLLLRGPSDPRPARQAGRPGRRRRRDLGDKRLRGDYRTRHQRRVRRQDAPRPRNRFPEELVGRGLEWSSLPAPREVPRRLAHAPRPPPSRRRDSQEKHGEPHGKTEAWHILWAAEGATILAGIKDGLSREELFEAFKTEDYDAVMPRHPVRAGDTVYVPGGIIHTFGPDTLIFEVQQTSDLGQFVMPEDLYGNRLSEEEWDANINATLDELKTDYLPRPNPGLVVQDGPNRRILCCAGPHFALERWTLTGPHTEPPTPNAVLPSRTWGTRCGSSTGEGRRGSSGPSLA